MKQALLFCVCILFFAPIFSQTIVGNQEVITVNTGGNPSTSQALLYLPDTYTTDTAHYPLIIFLGGTGEQGSDITLLLDNGTLPYQISQGFKPSAVNPVDGKTYKFIVFSPQGPAGSWGWQCVPHLETMLPQIEAGYRVDPSRIYITGMSAGGWGTWSCITDDTTFCKGLAAIAPISSAPAQNPQYIGNAATYNVPVWTICGDQDAFWPTAQQYTATINALNPKVPMKLTDLVGEGHSGWDQGYDPTWYDPSDPLKLNLYAWFLQYSRANAGAPKDTTPTAPTTPPVAVANNQTIAYPTDSVTLNGSQSYDSSGTIVSYQWTYLSGPIAPVINNSDSAITVVSQLAPGTYSMQLAVTNNNNQTGYDTVAITVKNNQLVAEAGPDVTLILPANTTVLNGSGSNAPGNVIVKYKWTKIAGPNQFNLNHNDSVIATLTNVVAGVYEIKLTVTNSKNITASDTVKVTVEGSAYTVCKGKRTYITKGSDNGFYLDASSFSYNPGDTLVLTAAQNPYSYFSLEDVKGTSSCPVTIINEGGVVSMTDGMAFSDCQYVNVTGTGTSDKYGFFVQDPNSAGVAIDIYGRSAYINVSNVQVHNKTYGFWVKEEASCIDSLQYPNWIINHISIHDNQIVNTNQEGMYLGSTDPNGTRGVACNGDTIYPKPLRLGNISVYNNIIDSTNRSGIQLSCASSGYNHIYNNTISNCGFEQNADQGNGISLGGYSHGYVHDNVITNTYALGILCLGSGHIKIENNTVTNSGVLGSTTVPGMANIMVDTRLTTPTDSTRVFVMNNTLNGNTDYGVRFYETYPTFRDSNVVCGNSNTVNVASTINWYGCDGLPGLNSTNKETLALRTPVANVITNSSINIYPNPATDILHVQLSQNLTGRIGLVVSDEQGRNLQSMTINNFTSGSIQDINVKSLTAGMYFLRIVGENETTVLKFIKQ